MSTVIHQIHNTKISAQEAADRFARDCFEGRDVEFRPDGTFQLVDGLKVYRPIMQPHGFDIVVVATP